MQNISLKKAVKNPRKILNVCCKRLFAVTYAREQRVKGVHTSAKTLPVITYIACTMRDTDVPFCSPGLVIHPHKAQGMLFRSSQV